jgi:HD-like signal output (HDOD) protein
MANAGTVPTYRSGAESKPAIGADSSHAERAAALAFLQKLAAEVSEGTVELPCFPDVVVRVSHALADPKTTSERVVTVVGAEPRLAAKILQTANSAAFNTSGKPLTDLRSGITRLGQQMVHSTVMAFAMQQLKNEQSLRSIAAPLGALWSRSIAVACICRLVAQRTKVAPDEAFLAGLLHGIGSLYIMVRAAMFTDTRNHNMSWIDLLAGWQASIGKAVLENWGFAESLCEAVGDQRDHDRRWKHDATLTDVLIASLVLADALELPAPRSIGTEGINAFLSVGVTPADCAAILAEADRRVLLVKQALA